MTAATGPVAMMPPSLPTGRPTNAEFPSSANTPPVSIMTPEPGTGAKAPAAVAPASAPSATARCPARRLSAARGCGREETAGRETTASRADPDFPSRASAGGIGRLIGANGAANEQPCPFT